MRPTRVTNVAFLTRWKYGSARPESLKPPSVRANPLLAGHGDVPAARTGTGGQSRSDPLSREDALCTSCGRPDEGEPLPRRRSAGTSPAVLFGSRVDGNGLDARAGRHAGALVETGGRVQRRRNTAVRVRAGGGQDAAARHGDGDLHADLVFLSRWTALPSGWQLTAN